MTDPNTPTTPNNPQDLIDQALSNVAAPNQTPTTTNEPSPTTPEPMLPTPEPLTPPPAAAEPVVEEKTEEVPAELTSAQTEPVSMPEPPKETKPMGEDMPLAFMDSAAVDASTTTQQATPDITVEPISPVNVAPALTINTNENAGSKPKKKGLKVAGIVAGLFLLFVTLGTIAYNSFGNPITIAGVTIGKNGRPSEIDNPGDCSGESNGGWLVWRNGECKVTGISGSTVDKNNDGVGDKDTVNPNLEIDANKLKSEGSCEGAGKGYVWCESVDSAGKSYAFCNTSGKGCNQAAIDKGYTIRVGVLKCVQKGTSWELDRPYYDSNTGDGAQTADDVLAAYEKTTGKDVDPCSVTYSTTSGKEQFICKEGVVGQGTATLPGILYTGGACTALNGKKFTGNLNCFCGTVQVDTANGHESYTSTCGCDKNPNPSTPTITTNPTLMCDSLTRTPTTTPVVGDKVTFTCVGASTPAGAVSLSYKFRYSLNSGAYVAMINKTATTSELTIASCGSYKVQCQACGTINGVLTCDPSWTAATQ